MYKFEGPCQVTKEMVRDGSREYLERLRDAVWEIHNFGYAHMDRQLPKIVQIM